jgi:hypothetical protein
MQGLSQIIGKTIDAVVVKESQRTPQFQVFLVFSDNTHFEFYCNTEEIGFNKRVYEGGLEKVRKYMTEESRRITFQSYRDKSNRIVVEKG